MEGDKCPVVEEWMEMEELVSRASKGTIALVRKNTIDRDTVSDNYEMLAPILTNFGMRPSIGLLEDLVGRFLFQCRPRGKPVPKGDEIKTEAWVIRNMISILASVARRPHIPRSPELRKLFECIGIPLPSPSEPAAAEGAGPGDDDELSEDPESEAATDDNEVEVEEAKKESLPENDLCSNPKDTNGAGGNSACVGNIPATPPFQRASSDVIVTPQPRSLLFSPMSGSKSSPHVAVKCGYRCLECKHMHINVERILENPCSATVLGCHSIVKKAIMCRHCEATSDCLDSFLKEACPSPPVVPEPASAEPIPAKAAPSELAPVSEAKGKTSMPPAEEQCMKRPKIAGDLYVAEEKMTKLLLLKSLQEERLKLQQLLAAKHQTMTGEPGLDNIETQPMAPTEAAAYATMIASASPVPVKDKSHAFPASVEPEADPQPASPKAHESSTGGTPTPATMAVPVAETAKVAKSADHPSPEVGDAASRAVGNENDMTAKPAAVDREPSISPAEQTQMAKSCDSGAGPRKGRPRGKGKAKASPKKGRKPKAKAAPKGRKPKVKATPKPKAKGKAKASKAKASNADPGEDPTPAAKRKAKTKAVTPTSKDEEAKDEAKPKDVVAKSNAKRHKSTGEEPEVHDEAKDVPKPKRSAKPKADSKAKQKTPANRSKQEASEAPRNEDNKTSTADAPSANDKKIDQKQRNARKSKAYRRAHKAAKDQGLSEEECTAAGRKAYAETD